MFAKRGINSTKKLVWKVEGLTYFTTDGAFGQRHLKLTYGHNKRLLFVL